MFKLTNYAAVLITLLFSVYTYQDASGLPGGWDKLADYGAATLLAAWSVKHAWDTQAAASKRENELQQRIAESRQEYTQQILAIETRNLTELRQLQSETTKARELLTATLAEVKAALFAMHDEISQLRASKTEELLRQLESLSKKVNG